MRIVVPPFPTGDVIAWAEQFGQREGTFVTLPDGSVVYRHPADSRDRCAGRTTDQFRDAAWVWNRYTAEVAGLPEPEQLAAVERLRAGLKRVGVLTEEPDALWPVLLEQADAGLL